jgi:hypothetical protein
MNMRRSAALLALFALVLAACGAAQALAPRVAVREAARETARLDGTVLSVTLVGAEKDVSALMDHGRPLTADDRRGLELLRSSRLTISVDPGADAKSSKDDRFAAALKLGDVDDALEVRAVDGILYARADVAGVTKLLDVPPATVAAAVSQAREAGLGFVEDAAAGRWLQFGLDGNHGSPLSGLAGGEAARLWDGFAATWGNDVKVTRLPADGTGDRYRLDVPMRRVYERLLPALRGLPGVPGQEDLPPAAAVPDRTASVDVWVAGGRIARGELDLAQFDPHKTGRVALRVDIAPLKGDIKAPAGAVKVDVGDILGPLFGGLAGAGTGVRG